MSWWRYAMALLLFHVVGTFFVYALQRLQGVLPLNPQQLGAISPDSSFNTAISFLTNTNWQGYAGESTMSNLTQMLALAVQNFVSAATGIAVVCALIRGFVRRKASGVGNAWLDLHRATTWLLLPLSIVLALALVSQGVIQNFKPNQTAQLTEAVVYQQPKTGADGQPLKDAKGNPVLETVKASTQTLPMGPVASQEAIKMLGTNGGGFFNANSAHPYENPTPLANFLQMLAIFSDSGRAGVHVRALGGRLASGRNDNRGDDLVVCRHGWRRILGRKPCQSAVGASGHGWPRRQSGRQGNALWSGCLCLVYRDYHGGLVRRGQHHA